MRIAIIGHFGGKAVFSDGQTIKTHSLYDALLRTKPDNVKIDQIDTYYIKRNPLRFLFSLMRSLFRNRKYIVLLSDKGRKIFFPVLYGMAKGLKKDIYHDAIGGRLEREIKANPRWKKYVSAFRGNWMESRALAEKLKTLGVENALYLPNFKRLEKLQQKDLPASYAKPFRFCMFSRVMPEKGVEDAIRAIGQINETQGEGTALLDIYGPVDEDNRLRFETCLQKAGSWCTYGGVVPSGNSVQVLRDYYMLLFPTHWRHEGMPGTIIDALSAGVPVIARQWQYCDEMLEHGVTGYIYPFDQPEKLYDMVLFAVEHGQNTMKMKPACLEKAGEYREDAVIAQIWRQLNIG